MDLPAEGSIITTPAVGVGAVVFADEGAYRAVNIDDGSERWALYWPHRARPAPVVTDDAVYVVTASPGTGARIVSARDPVTGDRLWSVDLIEGHHDTPLTSTRIPASMAYDGDSVYVVLNGEWMTGTMTPAGMPMVAEAGWLYKLDVTARRSTGSPSSAMGGTLGRPLSSGRSPSGRPTASRSSTRPMARSCG